MSLFCTFSGISPAYEDAIVWWFLSCNSLAIILLTLPAVTIFSLRLPLASALIFLETFLAMSLAIMKGTPDLPVVRAILSRSNFSFLRLDLRMLTATGRFLFFVCFLAETLLRLAAAFFGVRFWPVLFFLAICTAMAYKC
jgi:hypothetical protein